MRKTIIIILAAAALFSGCGSENGNGLAQGASYVFEGTVDVDGFVWSSTSDIGVYGLSEGVMVRNERCYIEGWGYQPPEGYEPGEDEEPWTPSAYEGASRAPFNSSSIKIRNGENEFLVCYPYTAGLTYVPSERAIYDLSVSSSQKTGGPDQVACPTAIGLCSGNSADGKFSFSLAPVAAILKVSISSEEFVGYGIKKISLGLTDAALSGYMDISVDDMSCKVNQTNDFVGLEVSKPSALEKGKSQTFFINMLPGDFSAEQFEVTVTMANSTTTVTLPIKKTGVKLEAGKVSALDISDLKSSDNCVGAWFCPVEGRVLCGKGYAYGQANTFLIQSKSSVYDGASLVPDPSIPESVVIDYRLRGEYKNAEIPEDVTFEWATTAGGTKNWMPRGDKVFDPDQYTFVQDADAYTVTVTNNGSFAGAPILLMKKNGKILWGWAFWAIAADGTVIEPVNVGGYDLMNLPIGIPSTNYDAWKSAAGHHSRSIYYYQWGRYLPVFWNTVYSMNWEDSAEGQAEVSNVGNVRALNGPYLTLEEALTQPAGVICHVGTDAMENWLVEEVGDLWGGTPGASSVEGKKTVYDPCPKGWRVPDYCAAQAIASLSGSATFETASGRKGVYVGEAFFGQYGYLDSPKALATQKTSLTGYSVLGNWSAGKAANFWTNYSESAGGNAAVMSFGPDDAETVVQVTSQYRALDIPVRCQRDSDNR